MPATLKPGQAGALSHYALFYRNRDEYASQVSAFIRDGLAAAEPVMVAVPVPRLELLRAALGTASAGVAFTDMRVLGANPARIIPAIRDFTASRAGRARFVGELHWAGRRPAETTEAHRHEALINAAFAEVPVTILCPYDTASLDAAVVRTARQTHPRVHEHGTIQASLAYGGTAVALAIGWQPPPAPPPGTPATVFARHDLPALREQLRSRALAEGLPPSRATDLMMAAHEIAANTITHAGGTGTARLWRDGGTLVCEIRDDGHITDPLAGRHPARTAGEGGHGLHLASQLCDLTEIRSGQWGTAIRLHIACR